MKYLQIFLVCFLISCAGKNETQFSKEALNENFISLNNESVKFQEILEKYKGKKILIDVWASWCADCIKGMPTIVNMQQEYEDVIFLFLSIDNSLEDLKSGILKYNVKGEHYLLPSGWDGVFGTFLDLSWIPRYIVVDEKGEILVFNTVKANDSRIIEVLSNTKAK